jgi:hypothetical protein
MTALRPFHSPLGARARGSSIVRTPPLPNCTPLSSLRSTCARMRVTLLSRAVMLHCLVPSLCIALTTGFPGIPWGVCAGEARAQGPHRARARGGGGGQVPTGKSQLSPLPAASSTSPCRPPPLPPPSPTMLPLTSLGPSQADSTQGVLHCSGHGDRPPEFANQSSTLAKDNSFSRSSIGRAWMCRPPPPLHTHTLPGRDCVRPAGRSGTHWSAP